MFSYNYMNMNQTILLGLKILSFQMQRLLSAFPFPVALSYGSTRCHFPEMQDSKLWIHKTAANCHSPEMQDYGSTRMLQIVILCHSLEIQDSHKWETSIEIQDSHKWESSISTVEITWFF